MPTIPSIPDNAPFSPEQRQWLNGWLAAVLGSDAMGSSASGSAPASAAPPEPLLLLFGSQTGTAEALAKRLGKDSEKKGFAPKVLGMEKVSGADFAAAKNVLLITSTYGDGEPPDNAREFWDWLQQDSAPRLENVGFSVLALGDTNYPAFCEFGKVCDQRLEQLGARRVYPRVDCDLEYDAPAKAWSEAVFGAIKSATPAAATSAPAAPAAPAKTAGLNGNGSHAEPAAAPSGWSRTNPYRARLIVNQPLNKPGSAKDVRHFEIDLGDSGMTYEVGDALNVKPSNCPELVDEVLRYLGATGTEIVPAGEATMPLREALTDFYDITKPKMELIKLAAERSGDSTLNALLAPDQKAALKDYLWGREAIDFVQLAAGKIGVDELPNLLKTLAIRAYSIASSIAMHPRQVHLTVGVVRYDAHGRSRKGVCSTYLAERVNNDIGLPVFIQKAHKFRLPKDLTRPIIMVGPGTGIAPFRAFLEERKISGATGSNWLFFGDQHRATDFLYEDQLLAWQADGHLTRLDLAFSRDQQQRVYVQDRMRDAANSEELFRWLEAGAHFYVCGDASRMAKDVDAELHAVIERHAGCSADAAKEYVARLKSEDRYQRDVY